ncbi:hypothetical protein CEXT_677841 [Caerostris extrusa]|uniref:Uncharacterized protein n=1 Tax=Caerostris extrusa TaxID=172846 RepID=A0AAV4RCF4_CAEEX|nr:hypothetical protein CEXT_677841 [Caerostris extrusa]
MIFVIVVCAFIGIVAVLAILTLWRKKHSRFVPDNKQSVFQVLVDAMDSILFVTSGKKNALHLYILKYFREKSKKFRRQPLFTHWLCGVPLVVIHKAEAVKSSGSVERKKRITQKSDFHEFFKPCVANVTVRSGKSEGSCSLLVSRAACSKDTSLSSMSMRRNWSSFCTRKRAKNSRALKDLFPCAPWIYCASAWTLPLLWTNQLFIRSFFLESILGVKIGALQSEAEEYVSSLQSYAHYVVVLG